jgi:nicotinate-nucleotide adenylyltransferase
MLRIGIYGGSFDPIHMGHLLIAETVRELCELDQVVFVPAATAPHKQDQQVTSAKHRRELVELAVGGYAPFSLDDRELERGGVSYTVDTLKAIHGERPDDRLFLIMGGDSLVDLPTWKSPQEICRLARPIVVARPGAPPPDPTILQTLMPDLSTNEIQSCLIELPLIEISSTDIRQRVQNGQPIRFRTPRSVEKYIETQGLYRD